MLEELIPYLWMLGGIVFIFIGVVGWYLLTEPVQPTKHQELMSAWERKNNKNTKV